MNRKIKTRSQRNLIKVRNCIDWKRKDYISPSMYPKQAKDSHKYGRQYTLCIERTIQRQKFSIY